MDFLLGFVLKSIPELYILADPQASQPHFENRFVDPKRGHFALKALVFKIFPSFAGEKELVCRRLRRLFPERFLKESLRQPLSSG